MAKKHQLRKLRAGTVINLAANKMESSLGGVLVRLASKLRVSGLRLKHERQWNLSTIVQNLQEHFPDVEFHCYFKNSSLRPDGGVLSIVDDAGLAYPILISEVKNQGTNDLRREEGKPKQAKGNAIERLGKNVIGFRAAMRHELIFPFVCFGDGCDFADDSSILDRVSTIAIFSELRSVRVMNEGPDGVFNRGSFYFRERAWTEPEMLGVCSEIAERAIHYYFSKYGKDRFIAKEV